MSDNSFLGCIKMTGTFDEDLNHISGNLNMQNFLGNNLMYSLYKIVHPDDEAKVRIMVENGKNAGDAAEIVRLMNGDEKYERFIFKIKYDAKAAAFDVEFVNADECEEILNILNSHVASLRAFLTVENNILFQYDSITGTFKVFWVSDKIDVTFYEMPFDVWQEQMVSLGYIEGEENLAVFHSMCSQIKELKQGSNYTFHGKIISKGERVDVNRIKFMAVGDENGNVKVVGRWNLVNEQSDEPMEDFCAESYLDPLTELLNKKTITQYAKDMLDDRNNSRVALAMFDLDNFKLVNDTYGHMFGDEVLKKVGKIIKDAVSGVAVAGRMGGDEFFLVFKDYVDELHLRNVLRTIKINIAAYFKGKIGDIPLSCSVGASRSDIDSRDYHRLFKVADKALYIAKQKGKNRYIIYKTELHGEFKFDENESQVEMKSDYYDEADIHDVSRWIKKVIVNGKAEINPLLEHMAVSFHFDRIGIYLNSGERCEYEYRKPGIMPGNGAMIQNRKYLEMFKNEMLLIENMNTLEYGTPDVYAQFKAIETKSTMQVLIRDLKDEVVGVVSFDSCRAFVTYPKKVIEYVNSYGNILAGLAIQEN